MSAMDSALSGLQEVGRVSTYLKTAVIVLVALFMMSIASSLARVAMQDPHDATASATLANTQCTSRTETTTDAKGRNPQTRTYYDCLGDATYSVAGSTYTKHLAFQGLTAPYANNSVAPVYYDPANAADVVSAQPISEWMAFAGSSLSCILAVMAIIWALIVKNSNVAAGFAGVEGVSDLARGIFNR